jgi:serine/threonine protein kinase/tetratricopeptide (TPR) repeat protein
MRVCAHCYRTLGDAERACSRDGGQPIEAAPLAFPAELQSKFQGLESFAQSPHSASFLATQPSSGFRGLLKIIPLRDLDASERGRLKRELRKQVKLAHPNLPRIVDGGELATDLWLLRDHVDGESLGQRLRRQGPLELPDALAVVAQVASALDELHRAGILHRDVRPSRIVLQPREAVPIVKLLDAGIAARHRTGSVFDRLGTPAYMSPEQIAGKLVSFRSDLYALGCVFYEMLTGRTPFGHGESPDALRALLDAHQNEAPPALPIELPPAIAGLLASLLDKEPRKRPFSAQQVRRTLEPHLPAGMPVVTPARSSVAGAPSPVTAGVSLGRGSVPMPNRPSTPPPGVLPPMRKSSASQTGPAREDLTEELDIPLEDITSGVESLGPPGGFNDSHTMEIPGEELASLRIDPSLAPPPAAAPVSIPVPADELEDSATTRLDADSAKAMLAGLTADKPASVLPAPPAPASEKPVSVPPPAAVPAPPRRASVAFDVESLFNDPQEDSPPPVVTAPVATASATPAGSRSARGAGDEDVAPTLLYQKRDDAAHAAYQQAVQEAEEDADANKDRTVVTRMPTAPTGFRNKLIASASVLAAVILLFAMCRGGDDDEEVPAAEAPPVGTRGDSVPAVDKTGEGAAAQRAGSAPVDSTAKPEPAAEDTAAQAAEAPPAEEAAAAPAPEETAVAPAATADTTNTATAPTTEGAASPARRNAPDAVVGQKASRAERVARAEKHKTEARAHFQAGRFREAARSYELATRETPSDGGAFAGLGASLLSANDPDGAIRAYQRAVQIDGKSSGFHAALGRAYSMKGDRARAKTAYTRALALNPNNGAAKQGLEKLK